MSSNSEFCDAKDSSVTGIIMLFALTVMKIRTPKFRVRSATFENFNVGTPTNPSFSLRMNAEFGIKNTNFGHFKYQNSTVRFFYGLTQVGELVVQKARAKARSTRKFNAMVKLSLANAAAANTQLGNDLSSGVVRLSSKSKLNGKVELMKVLMKKKSTDMNCSMEIVTATQQLRNIVCKSTATWGWEKSAPFFSDFGGWVGWVGVGG
ncbi:Late [Abeliophyllum distichum]|uniref:Late n=1 Tax=Abeliophyllum distichum TaxID=126358 RepID=A0ABD1TDT2_9LAMI